MRGVAGAYLEEVCGGKGGGLKRLRVDAVQLDSRILQLDVSYVRLIF